MATIDKTVGPYHDKSGGHLRRIGGYTGPASYATGGDSFTAAEMSMGRIIKLNVAVAANAALSTFRLLHWDPATQKVVWVVPNTGAEVAATTDLSGFTTRFEAIGI